MRNVGLYSKRTEVWMRTKFTMALSVIRLACTNQQAGDKIDMASQYTPRCRANSLVTRAACYYYEHIATTFWSSATIPNT